MLRRKRIFYSGLLAGFVLVFGGCNQDRSSAPREDAAPVGLSMAELESQHRAPLNVVTFVHSGGVGDVIMGMALESSDAAEEADEQGSETTVQRHVLKVENVSDREITAFRGVLTFEKENGEIVTSEDATPEIKFVAEPGDSLAVGDTAELEVPLVIPQGTKAKFSFAEIQYKEGGLGGIWRPAKDAE